jgi:hypothetical protein
MNLEEQRTTTPSNHPNPVATIDVWGDVSNGLWMRGKVHALMLTTSH